MTQENTMKTSDVAEYLGVSVNTVRIWREKGRGPKFIERGYSRYIYLREDVEQFAKDKGYVVA